MAKSTKKDYFNQLLAIEAVSENSELVEFINHELELLAKKSGKTTKTKNQKENDEILQTILNCMSTATTPHTITELQGLFEELSGYSNQKLSALMKKLVDSGKVTKEVIKKKSYFSIAEIAENTEE